MKLKTMLGWNTGFHGSMLPSHVTFFCEFSAILLLGCVVFVLFVGFVWVLAAENSTITVSHLLRISSS